MASFKNIFIKSKMNKDLDDRLLPQGEYRNAVNIQVSKSESEDVGALENVLGNSKDINFQEITGLTGVICIGYLVSEVNSSVFFFITTNTIQNNPTGKYDPAAQHFIIKSLISQGAATQNSILVKGPFLNFYEGNPIYGVNLLEDLLFWTDNRNQPRKININLAEQDSSHYRIEDTISVAKYMPYTAPLLWQEVTQKVIDESGNPTRLTPALGEYQTTMQDVVSPKLPDDTTDNPYEDTLYQGDPDYLEDKFIRFSYRFKFEDGEYSVYAPFTQECFIPQQDGYFLMKSATDIDDNDQSAAYRSTIVDFMENKVNQITLLIEMPEASDPALATTTLENTTDYFKITEVEILYKESDGTAVLVVDTIPASAIKAQYDAVNPVNTYLYKYSATKPFKTLPENQLIRVYDKVPVRAFGQEIISNRVVYSNFQTRHTPPDGIDYNVGVAPKSSFDVTTPLTPVSWTTSIIEYPNHTLKQNRNYQAGFVLSDRFGRTTSTLLSNAASIGAGTASQLSTVYSAYNPSTVNIGQWPGDSLYVQVNEPIPETPIETTLYPGTYNGDPASLDYNPLGFHSWKVVVKQQEQDYYNVYLPGILAAYPEDTALEIGLTSHAVLLNDNINKVPRDLTEIGPEQKQFRSSIQMFGRVDVTGIAGTVSTFGNTNKQYYPSRFSDTVSTIATMFDLFNIDDPAAIPTQYDYAFYEDESNPLIARISTQDQIGDVYSANPSDSVQRLAVYETEPVESRLDIYWETSTSGRVDHLNEQVAETGGQTIFRTQGFNWDFYEYWGQLPYPASSWSTTAVNPSPEPGGVSPTCPAIPETAYCGIARSVIAGPFWFEDNTFIPIQNVTVQGFTVTDGSGTDITSGFELLQIKGTGSTPAGVGNYVNYLGNTTSALIQDSFIIVNTDERVWLTSNPDARNFDVQIQVSDDSLLPAVPIKTFNYTPGSNGTVLDNIPTVTVGGQTTLSTTTPTYWGFNSTSIPAVPPVIEWVNSPGASSFRPPSQVVIDLGLTGTLVEFYGTNGANAGATPGPFSNNQFGLVWTIESQTKNGIPVTDLQMIPTSGIGRISEVSPGNARGPYDLDIKVTGPDGTDQTFSFTLTIGAPAADGSFGNGVISQDLRYDQSYIFSLHNTQLDAFDQLFQTDFPTTYPDIQSSFGSTLNNIKKNDFCNSYFNGTTGPQTLNLIQTPSTGVGQLTDGTGFIAMEVDFTAYFGGPPGAADSCRYSWAIEYRPFGGQWEAAVDIEGNILSWNTQLIGSTTTNPIQSNQTVNSGAAGTNNTTTETDLQFGVVGDFSTGTGLPPNPPGPSTNSNQVNAQNRLNVTMAPGQTRFTKWVAVGNSPTYGVSPSFGEYRIIVQTIGGDCSTCQGCGAPGPQNVKFNSSGIFARLLFGDFFYDLAPVQSFSYDVNINLRTSQSQALNETTWLTQLWAREPVHRYVSQWYQDPGLTIPFTGWNSAATGGAPGYISYISHATNGTGWAAPYNAGTTGPSNVNNARAAEGASTINAVFGGNQNRRTWACIVDPSTGIKQAQSSIFRTAP